MSKSLAAVLPHLSKSSLIMLAHLSDLGGPEMVVDTTTRALAFRSGLHPQSVYVGLRQLRKEGVIDLSPTIKRGGWAVWLFPGWTSDWPIPLRASLTTPATAGNGSPAVGPVKARAES